MKLRSYLRGTPARTLPVPDPACVKITKAGARCRLPAAKGSELCVIHQAQPVTAAS